LVLVANAVAGTLTYGPEETFKAIVIDQCDLTATELEAAPSLSPSAGADSGSPDIGTAIRAVCGCRDKPAADRASLYRQLELAEIGADPRSLALPCAGQEVQPSSPPLHYKARPLDGIWATAPYLHNGSVPTLADLLTPPAERPEVFRVGSHELDPIKVGFASAPTGEEEFVFDTKIDGNRNGGHPYGTALPDADKAALLEYLKSL
jgi:hypothetical protein